MAHFLQAVDDQETFDRLQLLEVSGAGMRALLSSPPVQYVLDCAIDFLVSGGQREEVGIEEGGC